MNDLVSIIVPIYNIENYLDLCVKSILAQSYQNFELLLVDDGSKDSSGKMCDDYAKKDSRIKVIHKVNGGLSDARNVGIDEAKGEILSFVDGDDCLNHLFLERLVSSMEKYQVDIVECGHKDFIDGIEEPNYLEDPPILKTKMMSCKEWVTETNLNGFLTCTAWNKIYKKKIFENIRYPKGRLFEDEGTTYKTIYRAKKIYRLYDELYYYRKRKGSISEDKAYSKKGIMDRYLSLKEKCAYFNELNEKEMRDFSTAKLAHFMITNYQYLKGQFDDEFIKNWIKEIKDNGKLLMTSGSVPFKYKVFVSSFLVKHLVD